MNAIRFKARFSRLRGRLGHSLAAALLALLPAACLSAAQVSQSEAIYPSDPLHALEAAAQDRILSTPDPDLYMRSLRTDPRRLITIVAIDDESMAELGIFRFWPRTYLAQVVDNLMAAPPRAIALDLLFDLSAPQEDAQLASAFKRARDRRPPTSIIIAAAGGRGVTRSPSGDLQFPPGFTPQPVLAEASVVASADALVDDRGVIRATPLVVRHGDVERPSLALAAVAAYIGRGSDRLSYTRRDPHTIMMGPREIPLDRSGLFRINYFGPPSRPGTPQTTFQTVSFADVLRGRADPNLWRDGIVFVGVLGAIGFGDDYWTPVSHLGGKMAGVEIQANAAATLYSGRYLRQPSLEAEVGLITGLALLVALVSANVGVLSAVVATAVLLGAFAVTVSLMFDSAGLQLPLVNPLLAGALAFVVVMVRRAAVAERQHSAVRRTLPLKPDNHGDTPTPPTSTR